MLFFYFFLSRQWSSPICHPLSSGIHYLHSSAIYHPLSSTIYHPPLFTIQHLLPSAIYYLLPSAIYHQLSSAIYNSRFSAIHKFFSKNLRYVKTPNILSIFFIETFVYDWVAHMYCSVGSMKWSTYLVGSLVPRVAGTISVSTASYRVPWWPGKYEYRNQEER